MKIKTIKAKVAAKVATSKAKIAAKVAKGNAKTSAKVNAKCKGGKCSPCADGDCDDGSCSPCSGGKCKPCAVALALVLVATLCGCGTTTPSRSQTINVHDCTITVIGSGDGGTTNEVPRVDIISQGMQIETSGTETQTATPSYTTDVKPDVDVNYNGPTKTAADGAQGIAEKLVDAFTSKGGSDCTDGSCTP